MDITNLITMANQIGAFYESMPDRTKALADIADHIRKFWEPRMRRELLAYYDQHCAGSQRAEFSDIVFQTIEKYKGMLAG